MVLQTLQYIRRNIMEKKVSPIFLFILKVKFLSLKISKIFHPYNTVLKVINVMFPLVLKVLKKFSLAFLSHQTLSGYCVLQPSDIPPVSKKLDPGDEANYRPASVLPLLLKVFEEII